LSDSSKNKVDGLLLKILSGLREFLLKRRSAILRELDLFDVRNFNSTQLFDLKEN